MNKRLQTLRKTYIFIAGSLTGILGILGVIPYSYTVNFHGQIILGMFQVNKIQTYIHIVSGVIALAVFFSGKQSWIVSGAKYFALFYTILAIWGLPAFVSVYDKALFGYVHVNAATEIFHLLVGAPGLLVGYVLDPQYKNDRDTE